jgi:NTP pyrophosphatase (non-canonical NTP hydrolase)
MKELFDSKQKKEHVEEELADVLFFVLRFAQMNNIDLKQALERKLIKNGEKYTVEKAKGNNKKYNEF